MEMTFRQYIDNPMGKKNAVFSQREMYKQLYTEKFNNLFLREAGKINYKMYRDSKKDNYIIHIKIPSETVKNFYYDAVIMFYTKDPAIKASNSLKDYSVQFFSNDPAFVYTYLHVFLKNNLFFEDLKPRASKLALRKEPKEKNPYGIPGYSKILYFAYIFMNSKNLFSKNAFLGADNYSAKKLVQNVEHCDRKIADRQQRGEQERKKAAKLRKEQEPTKRTVVRNNGRDAVIGRTKITDSVSSVAKVKTAKKSKFAKKAKKK